MEYLHLNITNEEFINKLKKSIEFNTPISFSRFGDGEIKHINNIAPDRYTYITMAKEDILTIINSAIAETDIIGIMDKNNEIAKKINYSENKWGIKCEYVQNIRKGKEVIVADHMVTRGKILGNIHNFKNIIQGKNIAIISPRTPLLKQNNIQKLLGVGIHFIETKMNMSLKDRDNMFLKFDKIKEPIVLYGCSVVGKDFAVQLKKRGKIALDFGATLDAWAGLCTRPWFKKNGLQSYCLIGG